MKIDVDVDRTIRLTEVYNSVVFETEEGEKLAVCMRDGGFEIGIKDQSVKAKNGEEYYNWYRILGGEIEAETLAGKKDVEPFKGDIVCQGCIPDSPPSPTKRVVKEGDRIIQE